MEKWLPLMEFAHLSGISTSTLRRRIRSKRIPFKLQNGKYLIRNDAILVPYERKEGSIQTGYLPPIGFDRQNDYDNIQEEDSLAARKERQTPPPPQQQQQQQIKKTTLLENEIDPGISLDLKKRTLSPITKATSRNRGWNRKKADNSYAGAEPAGRQIPATSSTLDLDAMMSEKSLNGATNNDSSQIELALLELKKEQSERIKERDRIISKKEMRIRELEEELADLQTLVKALESSLQKRS